MPDSPGTDVRPSCVTAPGKLFVAGEYAVVEPGRRAILVAVDRYITVRIAPAQDRSGWRVVSSSRQGSQPLRWRLTVGEIVSDGGDGMEHVFSALEVMEELRAARGLAERAYDLAIDSSLDDGRRKLGLGSSAAVTVAVVRAVAAVYGLHLSAEQEFKAALLAACAVAPTSGGDIAASVIGGWVEYRSPDRDHAQTVRSQQGVAVAVEAAWPGLFIGSIPAPARIALQVGWTGTPASTPELVGRMRRSRVADSEWMVEFGRRSDDCVEELSRALRTDDVAAACTVVRRARRLLGELHEASGLPIETPDLRELAESAEQIGAAGKSSGAGGGDCGIVVSAADADLSAMWSAWNVAGITRVDLAVAPSRRDECPR